MSNYPKALGHEGAGFVEEVGPGVRVTSVGDPMLLSYDYWCALMTGSGAVMNAARAKSDDIVLVTGLGVVRMAAIMAAKVLGCKEIIAVDRVASCLEIAQELGATKVLDTSKDGSDLATRISDLVNNQRIACTI
ncbi:Aryl-alcohol dehydrogenase [Fusarium sp. NRRL 52700]|nr:Aryl-alcohol dehydrogenase [Fusarium sp. NRRL 52700]